MNPTYSTDNSIKLNKTFANYSFHVEEQTAYHAMQEAAFRVAEYLLNKAPGSFAEIQGAYWWVSPFDNKLEIFCSPDSQYISPEDCSVFIASGFEGQGIDELNATRDSLEKWLANPIIFCGKQDDFDKLVNYWFSKS